MLLSNYIAGIGMSPTASPGQKRISENLYYNLRKHFEDEDDDFEAHIEWTPDINNLDAKLPDIVIFKKGKSTACISIEVCSKKQFNEIKLKIGILLDTYPTIHEFFVYVWDKQEWYMYGVDACGEEPSYSNILEIDLDDFI